MLGIKKGVLELIKWALVAIFFSLALIMIGKIMFSFPEFFVSVEKGKEQSLHLGEKLLYNITYKNMNISGLSILYVYNNGCFDVFMEGNLSGTVCKTNISAPFPFLYAFPDKEKAIVLFYANFSDRVREIDRYEMIKLEELNYKGFPAILAKDNFNITYILDKKRGVIYYINSSTFEATLVR